MWDKGFFFTRFEMCAQTMTPWLQWSWCYSMSWKMYSKWYVRDMFRFVLSRNVWVIKITYVTFENLHIEKWLVHQMPWIIKHTVLCKDICFLIYFKENQWIIMHTMYFFHKKMYRVLKSKYSGTCLIQTLLDVKKSLN